MEKPARGTRKNPSTKAGSRKEPWHREARPQFTAVLFGVGRNVWPTEAELSWRRELRRAHKLQVPQWRHLLARGTFLSLQLWLPALNQQWLAPGAAVQSGLSLPLHSLGSPGKEAQRPSWLKNPPVFFLLVTSGKCYTFIKTWQTH